MSKSNIAIDGAGYTLDGNGTGGIDLTNGIGQNPTRATISNVTIENLYILNGGVGTNGGGNDTFFNDYISNSLGGACIFLMGDCDYNNITFCTLNGSNGTAIEMVYGANYNGTITENNIMGGVMLWLSVGGNVDRNYWSDYLTRYPNATEIGSSGIGNTPYVYATGYQDSHPLMKPVAIPLTGSSLELPTSSSSSTSSNTLFIIIGSVVAVVIVAAVVFLMLLRIRKASVKN